MIRKYGQNLLSHVKRSEKSVQELWMPKSPTFSSVWMNRYQFAGLLRQSHPGKSLSAVQEDLGKHGTVEHSIQLEQISFFPNLHCQPSPPFGLRKLMTAPCESHPLYDISQIFCHELRDCENSLSFCQRKMYKNLIQGASSPAVYSRTMQLQQ